MTASPHARVRKSGSNQLPPEYPRDQGCRPVKQSFRVQFECVRFPAPQRLELVFRQAMGAEGLRDKYPFGRHLIGARIAGFVDGSTEMLLERLTGRYAKE